jgi:hypothetical protein
MENMPQDDPMHIRLQNLLFEALPDAPNPDLALFLHHITKSTEEDFIHLRYSRELLDRYPGLSNRVRELRERRSSIDVFSSACTPLISILTEAHYI